MGGIVMSERDYGDYKMISKEEYDKFLQWKYLSSSSTGSGYMDRIRNNVVDDARRKAKSESAGITVLSAIGAFVAGLVLGLLL
jgi:hypothetical protein